MYKLAILPHQTPLTNPSNDNDKELWQVKMF